MKKINFNFSKVLSVIISLSLLLSVVSPAVFASEKIKQNDISAIQSNSIVNSNYGTVTDYTDTGSNITVINIQDLHCHLQTQQNINNILKQIDKTAPINAILVEGGYDNINFNTINEIKDKNLRTKIINKMLEDGSLTGAEFFVLENEKENILKGIDNKKLHEENLSRLAKIIEKQDSYSKTLKKISEEIKILNNKYLNGKNVKFSNIIEQHKKGEISTSKFYRILFRYANYVNKNQMYENIVPVFTADYPNLSNYLNLSKQNSNINANKLSSQITEFILTLKKNLPYQQYKKLSSDTENFSDMVELANFITAYCRRENIDLSKNFSELNKFVKDIKLKQKINPAKLLSEEGKLISAIREGLSYDNTEYEISKMSDFFNYFEKYLTYSLTAYQWKYFEENFDSFKKLYSKYCITDKIKDIKNDFELINKYYAVNEERNYIFLEKICRRLEDWKIGGLETAGTAEQQRIGGLEDWKSGNDKQQTTTANDRFLTENIGNDSFKSAVVSSAAQLISSSAKVIVVVAGGFHSQELKDELTAKNINTITIMPKISTEIDTAKSEYENYVKIQDKMLSQALALRIAASAPLTEQKELIAKAALELLSNAAAENIKYLEQTLNIKINKFDKTKYTIHFDNNSEITIDTAETTSSEKKEIKNTKYNIKTLLETTLRMLPNKGFKSIFDPDIYSFVKSISLALFKFNIYFSDGIISEITTAKLKEPTIDGISLEAISTFMPEVQAMLLERQQRNGRVEEWKSGNDEQQTATTEQQRNGGFEDWKNRNDEQQTAETAKDTGLPRAKALAMTDEMETTGSPTTNLGDDTASRSTKTTGTAKKRFARVHTTLNKNFKMKISQEIVDALHLDDGHEFYITRLNNNTLIVSKREEQLGELVKIIIDIRKDNSRRGKDRATRYIYPNTYDFTLGKGNTINAKILYRPEIYREPLTQEQMDDINLLYDTREVEELEISNKILAINDETTGSPTTNFGDDTASRSTARTAEGQKQTRQTTRSNIQFTQQEQYDRHPRSFRNPINFSIFTPSIKSKAKYQDLYKHSLETVYKVSAPIKALIGKDSEKIYYEIIANSKNKDFLFSIINEPRLEVKHKLMAFMYLKINGYYIDDGTTDYIKGLFVDYMKKNMRPDSFRTYRVIRNNFDLRAIATGIFLLIDYLVVEEIQKEIYKKISLSVFVKGGSNTLANSGMFFADANPLTIAHEIGHNILDYTFGGLGTEKEVNTLHELFADVIANCFGEEIGLKENTSGNILYGLFDKETNLSHSKMFQEEHSASRGFINLLTTRSANLLGRNVYWSEMADTILDYIARKEYMYPNRSKIKSQKEILEDLFFYYFETLRKRQIILLYEQEKVNNFLENSSSAFSKMQDILNDIRKDSFRDYIDILNVFRTEISIPHSYFKKNRDKKKTFSYFSNKSSYEEMDDFVSAVILSQPDKKGKIISIIRQKILSLQAYNFSALKVLISLDVLEQSNNLMTKQDIDDEITYKLSLIPTKPFYENDDYYHIRDYFYFMDNTIIKDILAYARKTLGSEDYKLLLRRIKTEISFSLRYYYSKETSTQEKVTKLLKEIKYFLQEKRFYLIKEDIENLLIIDILLKNLNTYLFDKERLDFKLFKILKLINFAEKPFFTFEEYDELYSYLNHTNLLSAAYRVKFLNFIGIRNFGTQQEIISAWEYPQILLGMFFPKIREGFKKAHIGDIEERLSVLERDTAGKIKEIFNLSVEEVKELSFLNKIVTIAKILTNKSVIVYNRTRHLLLNGMRQSYIDRKFNTGKKEISVFYEDYDFWDAYLYDIVVQKKAVKIFVSENINRFKQKDLINTGLKVNGKTIWQVKNKKKWLIFVADNVNIRDTARALNGYKKLNKKIRKLTRTKNSVDLSIKSFTLIRGELSPLEDKNLRKAENKADTQKFKADTNVKGYIEMLAAA